MSDYLKIYKKFNNIKEISDLVNEVEKLRQYYQTQQFYLMQQHIVSLTQKYVAETIVWNLVNNEMPITYQQSYINAENFLAAYGAKLIVQKVKDFASQLNKDENNFINSLIKPME